MINLHPLEAMHPYCDPELQVGEKINLPLQRRDRNRTSESKVDLRTDRVGYL